MHIRYLLDEWDSQKSQKTVQNMISIENWYIATMSHYELKKTYGKSKY